MIINKNNQENYSLTGITDQDVPEIEQGFVQTDKRVRTRPLVSVIIPTLNESANLSLVLPYLPMQWIDEVILVDGHSTDNTIEKAKRIIPSIRVIMEKKRGKGAAMAAGYKAARGDILIVLDADGSNDPREIPRFIKALLEGADFVKGSRFAHGAGTTDMPRFRQLGNMGFVLISNLLFDVRFTDLCYGYHAFWRYCLDSIDFDCFDGFEIDTALYLQAAWKSLRIIEVPSFEGYRFFGIGKLQTFPDGFRVLKTIFEQYKEKLTYKEKELYKGFRGDIFSASENPKIFSKLSDRDSAQLNFQLEFIEVLSLMMLSGQDMHNAMQRVLRLMLDALDCESGSLILLDEQGNVRDGYLVFEDGTQANYSATWSDVIAKGLAGWVIKSGQAALVPSTQEDSRWLQRTWDNADRSAIAIPLTFGGMVMGALTLVRSQTDKFTQTELERIQHITSIPEIPS